MNWRSLPGSEVKWKEVQEAGDGRHAAGGGVGVMLLLLLLLLLKHEGTANAVQGVRI